MIFSEKVEFRQTAMAVLIRTTTNLTYVSVFGAVLFYCWIMPTVNESLSRERLKMKDDIIQGIKQEFEIENIEGQRHKAKISEGQSMQTSGTYLYALFLFVFFLSCACIKIQTL